MAADKSIPKRPSMRKALDAKCKDCIYDPEALGNWREQVFMCAVLTCPLYPLRPKPGDLTKSIEIMRNDPDHPWWKGSECSEMGLKGPAFEINGDGGVKGEGQE